MTRPRSPTARAAAVAAPLAALIATAGCVAQQPLYAPPVAQPIMLQPPPLPLAAAPEPALTPFQPMLPPESAKPAVASSSKPTVTEAAVSSTSSRARARPALPRSAVPLAGFRPMRAAPKPADNGI